MRRCSLHDPAQPAVCVTCARSAAARRARLQRLIVLGPLALVVAGGGAYLMTRPKPPAAPPPGDTIEGLQRGRLAKTPCDHETSMALVDHLIEQQRWRDATVFARSSLASCGVIGEMKWRLAYADGQLHDYADAERVTTELITEQPSDSDFWWWRGEDFSYHAQPEAALADFRQSLALSYSAQAAQFAANRFAVPAHDADATCEADRAWRYYVTVLAGEPAQEMRDEIAANARANTCTGELGTGRATIPSRTAVTMTAADATARGTLDVDARLGTTLISREFAARAGFVVADGPRCQATSRGKLYTGTPAKVTLRTGGAIARNVDVLITDDLEGDAAGILGLSFLWHFAFTYGENYTIELRPPSTKAI
ncbi:MAG: hypothetical protein ABI467_18640 [Kofleriaceae bacterium]